MKNRKSIEAAVASFRAKTGMQKLPAKVQEMAEKAGIRVTLADFEDTVSGALKITDGNAVMAINSNHSPNRQRFTIAHEIGHFVLHLRNAKAGEITAFVDGSLAIRRDDKSKDGTLEIEREANAFAAELLMPRARIEELMPTYNFDWHDEAAIRNWSKEFGVSEQALTVRLMSLGYLED